MEKEFLDPITDKLDESIAKVRENIGIFKIKSGNKWIDGAKLRPIPRMLLSELWYEGEICILFADTNVGKSILAVQIGDAISRGEPIPGFKLDTGPQQVIYFDFELSDKQFETRYSNDYKDHYRFDENFQRAEINPEVGDWEGSEDTIINSIEEVVKGTGAKIIIIDNITFLKSETDKPKYAISLMKRLKEVKNRHDLSILVLAHTPKREHTKPITKNDLAGSRMVLNFCDSAIGIGDSSSDKSYRYLKQIKERNSEKLYGSENVILCEINKESNFLCFKFIDFGYEQDHLKIISKEDAEAQEQIIVQLKKKDPSLSYRAIAEKVGTNHMKVKRTLKKHGL